MHTKEEKINRLFLYWLVCSLILIFFIELLVMISISLNEISIFPFNGRFLFCLTNLMDDLP